MERKQLVDSVIKEFGFKPGQSRRLVDHILCQLLEAGLSGEGFKSPILLITSKDLPERVVDTPEGSKTIPEQRVMRLRQARAYVSPFQKIATVGVDSSSHYSQSDEPL